MALKRPRARNSTPAQRAVTAATATVTLGKGGAWATWRFGNIEWQIEAWRLFDIVGELRFLAAWIGDSVSRCRLYVTRINEVGEETGEVADERIARLAAVPLGTGSQRDDNLRLLGIDLAVAGEAWIVGEAANTPNPEGWFVLSGTQIRREGGLITVRRPLQAGGEILKLTDGRDMLLRAWRPHPNDIWQSDSPTRSAIPPLREIELLTKREFAELESRLTGAGIWFLPEGMDFPVNEGEPETIQGFMAYLQSVAAENIRDQSRASAMVPIMATIPDSMIEHLDKIKPITFHSELSDKILEMKAAAIARVAASFEIPSELLAGLSNANHWTAWAISEEGIRRIQPYLATIADTLTRGFLIPALEREGIADADQYAYAFDVSPLAIRPNQLEGALQLRDRFLLTDEETVKAGAFTTEQMPTEQERIKMLLFSAVAANPQLLTDPGIQAALGIAPQAIPIQRAPADEPRALPSTSDEEDQDADGPPDTLDDGPPDGKAPGEGSAAVTGSRPDPVEALLRSRELQVAGKAIALRALELAGGRLATPGQRRGHLAGTPRHEIHARLGPVPAERAPRLLEGAWTHVAALAVDLRVSPPAFEERLARYCLDRLTTGQPHRDTDLAAALDGLG